MCILLIIVAYYGLQKQVVDIDVAKLIAQTLQRFSLPHFNNLCSEKILKFICRVNMCAAHQLATISIGEGTWVWFNSMEEW